MAETVPSTVKWNRKNTLVGEFERRLRAEKLLRAGPGCTAWNRGNENGKATMVMAMELLSSKQGKWWILFPLTLVCPDGEQIPSTTSEKLEVRTGRGSTLSVPGAAVRRSWSSTLQYLVERGGHMLDG